MLFAKRHVTTRRKLDRMPHIFLPLLLTFILMLVACTPNTGSILVLETADGSGFTMQFEAYSAKNKCTVALKAQETLQVEISKEAGEIALCISGKNGSNPYTGKDLSAGLFTVTVSEADDYDITITGKGATGKLTVKSLGVN